MQHKRKGISQYKKWLRPQAIANLVNLKLLDDTPMNTKTIITSLVIAPTIFVITSLVIL